MALTNEQMDAVMDYQDSDGDGSLQSGEVVEILTMQGHAAFRSLADGLDGGDMDGTGVPSLDDIGPPMKMVPAASSVLPEGMTVEMVPTGASAETALAVEEAPFETGLEGLAEDDFVMSYLKIKNAMMKDPDGTGIADVPDGHWFNDADPKEHTKERVLIFLKWGKGRAFMLPIDKEKRAYATTRILDESGVHVGDQGKAPVWTSSDRITPDEGRLREATRGPEAFKGPLHADCKTCPHAKRNSVGSRDCNENYRLLVVDMTEIDGAPLFSVVTYRAKGGAIRPVKALFSSFKRSIRIHKAPMWAFRVTCTTTWVEKGDKKWWAPVFSKPVLVSKEEAEEFQAALEGSEWS